MPDKTPIVFSVPDWAIYTYVASLCLAYIFVYSHTPIAVNVYAPHDDTLYLARAQDLANGRWLGPYDEFTLAKGPGYPLFLAFANWSGLPVTWVAGLLQCIAVTCFVAVCHRFIKSYLLSGLLFALLLWHPYLISFFPLRIIREAIYPAQVLLVFAALIFSLFSATTIRRQILGGILSGVLLGWFWLTREEGVWLLPGIAILIAAALLQSYQTWRNSVVTLAFMVAVFSTVQVGFAAMNWGYYGKFVGVDLNERHQQRALRAIHSVVSGGTRPYVSVTRAARERIYAVSPAFASLASYLDGTRGQAWGTISCNAVPVTCGDIGAGWFMWAFRDAAQTQGHFASPKRASKFFRRVAGEINAGCERGDLVCEPQLIAEMPHVTWTELKTIPQHYATAFRWLLLLNPPLFIPPSVGDEQPLSAALEFLNYPRHTSPASSASDAPPKDVERSDEVADQMRKFVLTNYRLVLVPVLVLGLLGFLLSTLLYRRKVLWNVAYVVAFACWTVTLSRLSVLVLMSATAIPIIVDAVLYYSAAFHMMVCAAVLSVAAFFQLWGTKRTIPSRARQAQYGSGELMPWVLRMSAIRVATLQNSF